MEWMISYMSKSTGDAESKRCQSSELSEVLRALEADFESTVRIDPTGPDAGMAWD